MENNIPLALLMSAKPCVRACAIAFLIPLAQIILFKALLHSGIKD